MLIDTSTIIEMLTHTKTSDEFKMIRQHLGSEEIYVLVVQLAELSDWCIENKVPPKEGVDAVKKFASIVALEEDVCLEGSRIKAERRKKGFRDFGLLDGLVLAAARSLGENLLTFDRDFLGEKDCVVLS